MYKRQGIKNKGFSFIEAVTICPTYYGRKNKKGEAIDMMKYLKENAINIAAYDKLTEEQKIGKFVVGELYKSDRPEYTEEYQKIIESFSKER